MKFSGKLMVFCLTILALVFILPLDVKAQYLDSTWCHISPLLPGDNTSSMPIFECGFDANMSNCDSAAGIDTTMMRFTVTHPGGTIVIFQGSGFSGAGLAPGFIMWRDSVVDGDGNIVIDKYFFTWDTLSPADSLDLGNCSYLFYGVYDVYISGWTKASGVKSGTFRVGSPDPNHTAEIIAQATPSLLDSVPDKPLFNIKFRVKNAYALWRPYAEYVPDDSLKFVIYPLPSGDSVVVFENGSLSDGFRMNKIEHINPTTGGDTAVNYYITWDTTGPADQLPTGEYMCIASGAYAYYVLDDTMMDIYPVDTSYFTVSSSLPETGDTLVSISTGAVSILAGNVSSRPTFKTLFKVDATLDEYGVGVPDSTLRFVIYDSVGESTVVVENGVVTEGFDMYKNGYNTDFPGADSMAVYFRWDPVDPAEPLSNGEYYCKIQGKYDVGWALFSSDSISFNVFGTAPQMTIINEGYVNAKGEFNLFLKSYGVSFGNFLDTNNLAIDFYLVNLPNTSSEERRYIKTLLSENIMFGNAEVETVKVGPDLSLVDGIGLDVFIYNGTAPDKAAYVDSADQTTAYPDSLSCGDIIGNMTGIIFVRSVVDGIAPQVTMLDSTDKAWRFYVNDAGSGVNDNSIVVKIDGAKVTSDTIVQYDENTDILTYYPLNLGALLSITATDKAGNKGSYSTYVQSGRLIIRDVHSYPNPFNPIKGERAKIVFKSNRENNQDAEMSAEVYDLAGKHIATLAQNADGELIWNGTTDEGELVANGAYFCYVKIKDLQDLKIENYLLKIAVVKKN